MVGTPMRKSVVAEFSALGAWIGVADGLEQLQSCGGQTATVGGRQTQASPRSTMCTQKRHPHRRQGTLTRYLGLHRVVLYFINGQRH